MDFALPLLDEIAPEVEPPIAYRKGGDPPKLVRVAEDELLESALREAVALEDLDGLLAVIVPRTLAVPDEFPFPILTPRQAKGLEFDHVVVVEPAAIADDGDRGLRELYVALTRPTKTLVVVHARPLPDALGADHGEIAADRSRCGLEPCSLEPLELILDGVGEIHYPVDEDRSRLAAERRRHRARSGRSAAARARRARKDRLPGPSR